VRAQRRAEARFPLDRVSRIIASAGVNWSAEALGACLERAIPIIIVKLDGSPLGSVQPVRLSASPLARAIEELLDWPDWRDIYACWLRAARMRVLTDWRQARAVAGNVPDPRAFQALVKRHLYAVETAPAHSTMLGLWRGAAYALAAEIAERWGVSGVIWGSPKDMIDLKRDLAGLIELRLRLEVSEGAEASLKGEAAMLLVFHALTKKLESEAGRAMRSLARRVNEVLSGCR
jgi:hypothetical protein